MDIPHYPPHQTKATRELTILWLFFFPGQFRPAMWLCHRKVRVMESTYKFKILDSEGKARTVEIKATSLDAAKTKLFKKYAPLVVYNNHF